MRTKAAIWAGTAILVIASQADADIELKHDSFVAGGTAGFQGGFAADEIGAVRFVSPAPGRTLTKVQLLFGGAMLERTVFLKVWDDAAGTVAPGNEQFTAAFQLTGSDTTMHELLLETSNIIIGGTQFRVGIQFDQGGLPSIATDIDGAVPDKNFIFDGTTWMAASTLGLNADFIIRAFVSEPGSDAGVHVGCTVHNECPSGNFCDNGSCAQECTSPTDCGGEPCNQFGMCPPAADDGGCCRTNSGPTGAALLGLGVLLLTRRRRLGISNVRRLTSRCLGRACSTTAS